jgi:hypothetical protein
MTIPAQFATELADRMNYRAGFNDAAVSKVPSGYGYDVSSEPMPAAYLAGYEDGAKA